MICIFKQPIRTYFALILILLLGISCRETIKTFSDLTSLTEELIHEYKHEKVYVVLQHSNVLGITFSNSPFNNLSEQERGRKAREVAFFAKNHYRSINSIDRIWVSFVISKTYIILHHNNGLGTYVFNKRELTAGNMSVSSEQEGDVIATYSPDTKQTSVYLKKNVQLQLESRSNVMLLPHLIISAENMQAPRRGSPESVTLDFTSYSDHRMFPQDPRLIISVDGQQVFSGTAHLTNVMGSNAEKSVNEFLSQDISYHQFAQLASGKRVKIFLGSKEFELKPDQLKPLQSMRKCAEELICQ